MNSKQIYKTEQCLLLGNRIDFLLSRIIKLMTPSKAKVVLVCYQPHLRLWISKFEVPQLWHKPNECKAPTSITCIIYLGLKDMVKANTAVCAHPADWSSVGNSLKSNGTDLVSSSVGTLNRVTNSLRYSWEKFARN